MDTLVGCRRQGRWQIQLAMQCTFILCIAFVLFACGEESPPTPTAIPTPIPLLPTEPPPVTPTQEAQEQSSPLTSLTNGEGLATATTSPLSSAITQNTDVSSAIGITAAGEITMAITPAVNVTTTEVVTVGQSITAEIVPDTALNCATETDVALLSYPTPGTHLGCAQAEASFDPVALNEFGTGPDYDRFMLWFSSENQIYVLAPDKTWQAYADTWTEEQETFTCNPLNGEASSPPLPRRGFGKIWCTVEGVQAMMGTVEREERLCQHTVTQRFEHGRLVACYEDATIRFFRIMDDHSWDQMLIR